MLVAREIAPDVYCLGPKGRTQTDVYFLGSGSSWTLIDAGRAKDGPAIKQAAAQGRITWCSGAIAVTCLSTRRLARRLDRLGVPFPRSRVGNAQHAKSAERSRHLADHLRTAMLLSDHGHDASAPVTIRTARDHHLIDPVPDSSRAPSSPSVHAANCQRRLAP